MDKLNKSVIFSLCSNLFHYYAFSVYAFSAVILSPMFFSTIEAEVSRFLGLLTLSMLLVLRPLGNIIFGHIGDKYGRKKALTYCLIAITVSTTSIGLIPSYSSIGYLSAVLLTICLIVQGICVGGQYTGAIVFIQEHTKKQNAAFACGLMAGIGIFGSLLGTATSLIFYHTQELDWTWRLPFLLTSIMGLLLYHLTHYIEETPDFVVNKGTEQKEKMPAMHMIRHYKKTLCAAICISSVPNALFYLAAAYLPNFYGEQSDGGIAVNPLSLSCFAQILGVILVPLFGYLADKVGKERQLKISSILLIISPVVLFYFMVNFNNVYMLIAGISTLILFVALCAGAGPSFLSESFPVIGRYSGLGLGISIGEGLFGAISPIICLTLVKVFDSMIAPAYYMMFLGILSFSGILLMKKKPDSVLRERKSGILETNGAS